MNKITVRQIGGKEPNVRRYFEEELDIVYAIIGKRVYAQYGQNKVYEFDLVKLSSRSQEHMNIMYKLQAELGYRNYSVFKLPPLVVGKPWQDYP